MNRRLAVAVAAMALSSTCCTGGSDNGDTSGGVEHWSGMVSDLRFTWSSDPGIDLLTGPAVPIRAFVESVQLAQYAGNLDYAYPGFEQATAEQPPADVPWSQRPSLDHALTKPLIGTDRYHILSIARNGRTVAATICNFRYAVASERQDGTFESAGQTGVGDAKGIDVVRVALTEPSSPSDLPPQSGPEPAPSNDVFGEWTVTGLLNFFASGKPGFDTAWPSYREDIASCVDKAPSSLEERQFFVDGEHPRNDFPTSPPSPGWPAPPSQ
ncbi:MAG: hypothetical protein K0Q46_6672 [Rhodococcus erythropolis]|nr:hypothetical protein [Rhodococcus erythropolis]MDF2899886.1 hypothetical protein [Rhodococcus erythropolis]